MQNVPKQVLDVTEIVRQAGGRVVGRTRLQKVVYLLEITGLGTGFSFEYRHYGPFSESLASAISVARSIGLIDETETPTTWGGWYSTYEARDKKCNPNDPKNAFLQAASLANPVELELAATAAFLHLAGQSEPWEETARRKPDKAASIDAAKTLYARLRRFEMPHPLPNI